MHNRQGLVEYLREERGQGYTCHALRMGLWTEEIRSLYGILITDSALTLHHQTQGPVDTLVF